MTLTQISKFFSQSKFKNLEEQILFLIHTQYPDIYKNSKLLLQHNTFPYFTLTIPLICMINKILENYTPIYLLKFTHNETSGVIINIQLKNKSDRHIQIRYHKVLQLISQDISGKKLQKYIVQQLEKNINIERYIDE